MAITVRALLACWAIAYCMPAMADDNAAHRADVQKKSMQVMPFSMDSTKHVFTPTADGGVQTVVVIDGDGSLVHGIGIE